MELARLGPATPHFEDRGALVHEVLRGCDAYERDFADELDKGTGERDSGGGEAIRALFESALLKNLNAVNLEAFYDPKRVRTLRSANRDYRYAKELSMGTAKIKDKYFDNKTKAYLRFVVHDAAGTQRGLYRDRSRAGFHPARQQFARCVPHIHRIGGDYQRTRHAARKSTHPCTIET